MEQYSTPELEPERTAILTQSSAPKSLDQTAEAQAISARRLPVAAILGTCLFLIGTSSAAIAPYRAIVAIDNLGISNSIYALIMTLTSVGTAVASLMDVVTVVSTFTAAAAFAALSSQESYITIFVAASILSLAGAGTIALSRIPRLMRAEELTRPD